MADQRSMLRFSDLVVLGAHGLRARPLRAVLSALGIAIGIAAMVAVLAASTSSQELVRRQLDSLGTNMLTAQPAGIGGKAQPLAAIAPEAVAGIEGVESVAWLAVRDDVNVYRNEHIASGDTGGISVAVGSDSLLSTTKTKLSAGRWFDGTTEKYPTTVLGDAAATQLGVTDVGEQVLLGGRLTTVIGILAPSLLAPDVDMQAFIGDAFARENGGFDGRPTMLYERSSDDRVAAVFDVLAQTIAPASPVTVKVTRPSEDLATKFVVNDAVSGLVIGVGAIGLLVGGIGVANTMVVSVIERRVEIGLRRSLGATRRHIAQQFVFEAVLLAALGGVAGVLLGSGVAAVIATVNGWPTVIPLALLGAGVGATVVIGAIAGALPAMRAARTSPTVVMSA